MPEKLKTEKLKTNAGRHLSKMVGDTYMDLHAKSAQGAFVVWIAINVPAELFLGFENVVYGVPESHAALTAAKGVGVLQCEKAEHMGYSMDLCSYARIDIGSVSDGGKDSPTFGLPKPDLLVSDNNNCSLLVKWFDVHHRRMGVPHFVIDVPFCYEPQKDKDRKYIIQQFNDLIRTIEEMSGQKFDMDKALAAVSNTSEGIVHWKRFLSFAENRPSGITAFDSFVQMAPFLVARGTSQFVDHYKLLAQETEQRVRDGQFPVPGEKYRLFWDNIAPWHQLRDMSGSLAKLGANIVGATYTSCIGTVEGSFDFYAFDGDDPLEYCARTQNCYICPHGMNLRGKSMQAVVEKLNIDGIVFASNRSCKPYSVTQLDQQKLMTDQFGVPSVMIDVDHADARKYSKESTFTRLEALLENIEAKRAA
ncbi:MAG: 2-hydroxyacyl-CoA dehydratase [Desulfobacteraceae bacterium]|nr:2-hydroxyacyl-CoA dehydratase [Desulfobacteraceae bacterium]MBC2755382.1 2-hydroxyacyl-CoA dehydratase [Desulfobacteraceae bacterium]